MRAMRHCRGVEKQISHPVCGSIMDGACYA